MPSDDAPAKDARLSRRLVLLRSLAGASSGALALTAASTARAQQSGITDTDPEDPEGNGRGSNRPAGVTDTDPTDPPGRGRGGPSQGVTDRDPNDPPGRGRGNRRRAIDADPTD